MSKKVLITGSSAGFGQLTVNTLIKSGHQVAASMRDPNGRNKKVADELRSAGAKIVELDVTQESSVEKGCGQAVRELGGLDVVVNNAGVGILGLQESYTAEDWKKIFDVNVFGVQRVNRAVLPHLREQRSGLLVQISSILGRITLPFYGPYNATKWAVEAMAENYRWELSSFGVDSVIIEPGGFPTSFFNALLKPSDQSREASYGDIANMPQHAFEAFEGALKQNPEQNPQNVADAILKVIDTPAGQRPFRTIVDKMGMGDPIGGYNEQLEKITTGIFGAFGMDGVMKLQTK